LPYSLILKATLLSISSSVEEQWPSKPLVVGSNPT
jgi:hypothetical protein